MRVDATASGLLAADRDLHTTSTGDHGILEGTFAHEDNLRGGHTLKVKDKKPGIAPGVPAEVSGDDRTALTDAYKTGLIQAWRRDAAHGYCLTPGSGPDVYVEVDRLRKYLDGLKAS